MKKFNVHYAENTKPPTGTLLKNIENKFGSVPNVFAVIAESSFNPTSREIIQIAAGLENQCSYGISGHTVFAGTQNKLPEIIGALRSNQAIEIILGICVKTFSNFANNVIGIPLEDQFVGHEWQANPKQDVA